MEIKECLNKVMDRCLLVQVDMVEVSQGLAQVVDGTNSPRVNLTATVMDTVDISPEQGEAVAT